MASTCDRPSPRRSSRAQAAISVDAGRTSCEDHKMHTVQSLVRDLEASGIPREATVFVHSGMRAIGDVEDRAEGVINALVDYFGPGLLAAPSHTWMTVHQDRDVFDPATTPSCVGIISQLFWQRPDATRSWHPTHSVAAIGEEAEWLTADEHLTTTPCPRTGTYGRLLDRDAYLVFMGCPMTKNTFVHGVEEWLDIPNRIASKATALSVRTPDGDVIATPQFMHDAPINDVSDNYQKLQKPLADLGQLRTVRFGDADMHITTTTAVAALATQLLQRDPDLFLTPDPVPSEWYLPRG